VVTAQNTFIARERELREEKREVIPAENRERERGTHCI